MSAASARQRCIEIIEHFPEERLLQLVVSLEDMAKQPNYNDEREFWTRIDGLIDAAVDESMPNFPRANYGRELVVFSDKE